MIDSRDERFLVACKHVMSAFRFVHQSEPMKMLSIIPDPSATSKITITLFCINGYKIVNFIRIIADFSNF